MTRTYYTTIHGFEEYKVVSIWDNCLVANSYLRLPYNYMQVSDRYVINDNLPVKAILEPSPYRYVNSVSFEHSLYTDHRELLNSAKKLYTHPSCKISRSLINGKYKKSLDPWSADAVVMPKVDTVNCSLIDCALFISEQYKTIAMVQICNDTTLATASAIPLETKFKDCILTYPKDYNTLYPSDAVMCAELFYVGKILSIPGSDGYILDAITGVLPLNKVVLEESVQESLGDNTNQLTLDSLTSIKDMLDSTDNNTVSAGLKALSMMDWMHYPNSVKYMVSQTNRQNWRYNPATSSISVKYMLKTLSGSSNRRHWPGQYDTEIYEEDYELFKQLQVYYEHAEPEKILNYLKFMDFMTITNGMLHPRIKERKTA